MHKVKEAIAAVEAFGYTVGYSKDLPPGESHQPPLTATHPKRLPVEISTEGKIDGLWIPEWKAAQAAHPAPLPKGMHDLVHRVPAPAYSPKGLAKSFVAEFSQAYNMPELAYVEPIIKGNENDHFLFTATIRPTGQLAALTDHAKVEVLVWLADENGQMYADVVVAYSRKRRSFWLDLEDKRDGFESHQVYKGFVDMDAFRRITQLNQ